MARFGSLYASGFGDPEQHVKSPVKVYSLRSNTAVGIQFAHATSFGDSWFAVFLNARFVANVYLADGETSDMITVPSSGTAQAVVILRLGHTSTYSMERVARSFDSATAQTVRIAWTWTPEELSVIDSDGEVNGDLSAWNLTGIKPRTVEQQDDITRGEFEVDMSTSGTTAVTLTRDNVEVASGTVTAPATLTLTASNGSGISGTVAVGAGPTDISDSALHIRWPESMKIKRGTSDPPTVVVDTVYFDGNIEGYYLEPDALAADTYYYRLLPVSDTGEDGTESASSTAIIPGPPGAPSDLAYSSGAAAATVLSFTASSTVGATYRAYVQDIDDDYMDVNNIAATAIAGATTITLPAITNYAGTAYAIVRAVNGGVEERNGIAVALEYDAAGARVAPRPNTPSFQEPEVSSGLVVTLTGVYNSDGEAGTASKLQLFVRDHDGAYDFNSPADETDLTASTKSNISTAALTDTLTNGWYYVTVKASTAAGAQSSGYADETLIYISDSSAAQPVATVTVSRG